MTWHLKMLGTDDRALCFGIDLAPGRRCLVLMIMSRVPLPCACMPAKSCMCAKALGMAGRRRGQVPCLFHGVGLTAWWCSDWGGKFGAAMTPRGVLRLYHRSGMATCLVLLIRVVRVVLLIRVVRPAVEGNTHA